MGGVQPGGVVRELDQRHPIGLEMAPEAGHPAAEGLVHPIGRNRAQLRGQLAHQSLEPEPVIGRGASQALAAKRQAHHDDRHGLDDQEQAGNPLIEDGREQTQSPRTAQCGLGGR